MLHDEQVLTFSEAASRLPRFHGRKVHTSTLWRWARKGVKGVRLETRRLGGRFVTSLEALERFSKKLAEPVDDPAPAPARASPRVCRRTPDQRQRAIADFMYNEGSARGYWLGKAYKPITENTGEGYNRWRFPGGDVVLNLRFATKMGSSLIDGKPAFLMYYGAFNDTTLVDELRKLDDYIYLGMGTTEDEDGNRGDPGHFVLAGPTDDWVGVGDS